MNAISTSIRTRFYAKFRLSCSQFIGQNVTKNSNSIRFSYVNYSNDLDTVSGSLTITLSVGRQKYFTVSIQLNLTSKIDYVRSRPEDNNIWYSVYVETCSPNIELLYLIGNSVWFSSEREYKIYLTTATKIVNNQSTLYRQTSYYPAISHK